jgi:hypothetical protein
VCNWKLSLNYGEREMISYLTYGLIYYAIACCITFYWHYHHPETKEILLADIFYVMFAGAFLFPILLIGHVSDYAENTIIYRKKK